MRVSRSHMASGLPPPPCCAIIKGAFPFRFFGFFVFVSYVDFDRCFLLMPLDAVPRVLRLVRSISVVKVLWLSAVERCGLCFMRCIKHNKILGQSRVSYVMTIL